MPVLVLRNSVVLPLLSLAMLGLGGCTLRAYQAPQATPEEQVLLTQFARDRFTEITLLSRNEDGHLAISARQGETEGHYLLAPAIDGATVLTIRRIDEKTRLPNTTAPIHPGTGPEPRGLFR